MGEVWKARDTRLDRIVAIKRLKAEHSERFQREARAIAALNHPHICQIYDVGPDYLVMEHVEGKPLKGPLAIDEALRLAVQTAGALEEAHGRGILHRDLKPGNILVTEKGSTKLLDFGLAKLMNSDSEVTMTIAGAVMGTRAYMSPEQAEGRPIDERSDVFSFGAVLYEMLCGSRAFQGMAAVLRDEPAPLQSPAAAIVNKCLAKEPRQRYQTVTDMRTALQELSDKPAPQGPSIAVLPFANMSGDKENEYFSDGLAEEILNALAQVPGLRVIARTSAFAFKGQNIDIRRIAEMLGVANILEGSVRKAGNRIRVTAQLVSATGGSQLWSQRYERELEDVFAVQDEIAAAIAGALQVKLAVAPRRYTPSLAAYEAFLQGRHHWAKLTPESLARSRECFEQAVALDPQFALARNSLAEHFFALAANSLMPAHEAIPRVREGARAALEIDPSLAEPHALLGLVAAMYDYDWSEAAGQFRLAMSHEPVAPHVRWLYGQYLMQIGRNGEAAEETERALQDDPLHLLCRCHLAACLGTMGRYSETFKQLRQVLEIDENFRIAHLYMAMFQALEGLLTEARISAERAYSLMPWSAGAIGLLAGITARGGDAARAETLLTQLKSGGAQGLLLGWALYHIVRLETEQAAEWFEKAIEQREFGATVLLAYVRKSSRWPRLAKMMDLPEAAA